MTIDLKYNQSHSNNQSHIWIPQMVLIHSFIHFVTPTILNKIHLQLYCSWIIVLDCSNPSLDILVSSPLTASSYEKEVTRCKRQLEQGIVDSEEKWNVTFQLRVTRKMLKKVQSKLLSIYEENGSDSDWQFFEVVLNLYTFQIFFLLI